MTNVEAPTAPARGALVPALLRLAGPVALARLGIMGMGIVDTIMVGQLAPHQLADLALGWAPTGVVLVTGLGLLTGVQVLGARALGEAHEGLQAVGVALRAQRFPMQKTLVEPARGRHGAEEFAGAHRKVGRGERDDAAVLFDDSLGAKFSPRGIDA